MTELVPARVTADQQRPCGTSCSPRPTGVIIQFIQAELAVS